MGKFAGFLKRLKKVAGLGSSILSGINDVYKGIKPYADTFISSVVPGGEYINKGLNMASGWIDNVKPYAQKYLIDETNKEQLENLEKNIKRYGGNITQRALNNYLDEQEAIYNNRGNYTLNDLSIDLTRSYAGNTAGDVAKGLIKSANNFKSIFGQPLNQKSNYDE